MGKAEKGWADPKRQGGEEAHGREKMAGTHLHLLQNSSLTVFSRTSLLFHSALRSQLL